MFLAIDLSASWRTEKSYDEKYHSRILVGERTMSLGCLERKKKEKKREITGKGRIWIKELHAGKKMWYARITCTQTNKMNMKIIRKHICM